RGVRPSPAGFGAEDAVQEERRGGALHPREAPLAAQRLAEIPTDAGLEEIGADVDQDDMKRSPVPIEIRSQQLGGVEAIDLRPGKADGAVGELETCRIAFEERTADVREGRRVVSDECGDPGADLGGGLAWRGAGERLPERLGRASLDELLDGPSQASL